jgi:hypothetical protein
MEEHVLTCFQSQDPQISLEPVVQGPIAETEETARAGIQETAKLMAAQFEHHPEDTYGSPLLLVVGRTFVDCK